jgi:DsbE subfamily thiol:disulfide oxidoreductase
MQRAKIAWRWAFLLPVAAVAVLMVLFVRQLDLAPRVHVQSDTLDTPAPRLDLPPLSSVQPGLSRGDLRGRVTLVNFFASWCVPCRAENPVLFAVRRAGIAVIGIDYKDKPADAMAFLKAQGNPYAAIARDGDGGAGAGYGITGVPESFLIDRQGVIRFRWAGPLTDDIVRSRIVPLARKLVD